MEIANAAPLGPSCIHARTPKKFTTIVQNVIVVMNAVIRVHKRSNPIDNNTNKYYNLTHNTT